MLERSIAGVGQHTIPDTNREENVPDINLWQRLFNKKEAWVVAGMTRSVVDVWPS